MVLIVGDTILRQTRQRRKGSRWKGVRVGSFVSEGIGQVLVVVDPALVAGLVTWMASLCGRVRVCKAG